jgi:hypothetical protein
MTTINTDLLLTIEQFSHHLGRAGAAWNFDQFCRAQGWTTTSLHDGESMYRYAVEKFHKFQDVAHFLNNNDPILLQRIVLAHLAEQAQARQ